VRIRKREFENENLLTLIGFSERKYTNGITDKEACLLLIGTIKSCDTKCRYGGSNSSLIGYIVTRENNKYVHD